MQSKTAFQQACLARACSDGDRSSGLSVPVIHSLYLLQHLYAGIYKGLFNSYFLFADEMAALAEFKAVGMDAGTSRSVVRAAVRPMLGI